MKYKLAVILCLIFSGGINAQDTRCVEPLPELVEIYEELNKMFPNSDYVILRQDEASYWVNRTTAISPDMREKIKQIFLSHNLTFSEKEEVLSEQEKISRDMVFSATLHGSKRDQTNYVELLCNDEGLHFYYYSKLLKPVLSYEANDRIAEEFDRLFAKYTSKKGVTNKPIVYDGYTYMYQLVTFNNSQQLKQHAEGIIYTVPNCKESDWKLFFDLMKGYAFKSGIKVAWNDVYRDYEAVEILVERENTIPIVFGATFRNGIMKLIRLEGTMDHNIVLPRVWPEESPVFNPKENVDYINKK